MAAQEFDLGLDRLFVSAEEWTVMPTGHPDELPKWCGGGGAGAWFRGDALVMVEDDDQKRQAIRLACCPDR